MNFTPSISAPTLPSGPLELNILRTTYLRGPNMWTYREVLEVWLDLGVLEEWPSNKLPGFVDRLLAVTAFWSVCAPAPGWDMCWNT